jgi:glycosyltransferase involved in cell wall biosynthesis
VVKNKKNPVNRKMQPLVSAVMIVHNGEEYIRVALESIFNQTYPYLEVIVIDDGSTDRTRQEIELTGKQVRYFFQEKSGIAVAMNRGVAESQGTFLSFLDSDDFWEKTKTEKQVVYMQSNPNIVACFGYVKQFFSPELTAEQTKSMYCPPDPVPGYSSGAMLIRKSDFLQIGSFDTKWQKGIFSDWFLRAKEKKISMHLFEDVVLYRRIHLHNHGITRRDSYIDYVKMLKSSLDRRRIKE